MSYYKETQQKRNYIVFAQPKSQACKATEAINNPKSRL